MVLLVTFITAPSLKMPPPNRAAAFPVIVQLVTFTVPTLALLVLMPPPAVLPSTLPLVTVRPEIVTVLVVVELKMGKGGVVLTVLRCTVSLSAPGPVMLILVLKSGSAVAQADGPEYPIEIGISRGDVEEDPVIAPVANRRLNRRSQGAVVRAVVALRHRTHVMAVARTVDSVCDSTRRRTYSQALLRLHPEQWQ